MDRVIFKVKQHRKYYKRMKDHIHNSTGNDKKAKSENPKNTATIQGSEPTLAHEIKTRKKYYQTGIRLPKVPQQGLLIMRYENPITISFD